VKSGCKSGCKSNGFRRVVVKVDVRVMVSEKWFVKSGGKSNGL
jgi:hypothetical protein